MKKIKYFMAFISLVMAVGLVTAIATLKNIPESFDWNLEEDADEDYKTFYRCYKSTYTESILQTPRVINIIMSFYWKNIYKLFKVF
jgi:hypothetical protein